MTRPDVIQRFFPAYAALTCRKSGAPSLGDYKKWVRRVAFSEFADELIVAAAAAELCIKITVVPYTPPDAATPWKITEYGVASRGHVYLGNDDVHYVWLGQRS